MITILLRKRHNRELIKRGMKDNFFYRTIVSIYPQEGSKTYNFYKDLMAKCAVNVSVENLISIKIVFVVLALIIYIAVTNTTVLYEIDEIVQDISSDSNSMLLATSNDKSKMTKAQLAKYEKEQKEKKELEQKEKEVYYKLEEVYGNIVLEKEKNEMVSILTNYVHLNGLKVTEEADYDLATRMYDKLLEIAQKRKVDFIGLFYLLLGSFFVPEVYLYLRKFLVGQFAYNEYLQLEVNTIMIGKLEPIKVEEILTVLSKTSRYFKLYIDEVRFNYFDIKDGYEDAFESVITKVKSKELKYLLKALQQASEGDLKMTIENLENQRLSNKEFRAIREQNKLKKKDLFGIVIVLLALVVICAYAFAPFGEILGGGLDLGFSI